MNSLMITSTSRLRLGALLAFSFPCAALAQATPLQTRQSSAVPSTLTPETEQTAEILGLADPIAKLRTILAQAPCSSIMSPEEMSVRQQISELIQASNLDVDGVLSEIVNERNGLSDLRTALQSRRDHTVGLLNSAALITGSGIGVAAVATQFTTLSTTTQNVGDGIGVGSGVASTILSFIAVRKQSGPKASVGEMPNMLAPLFDEAPVLYTYYPPTVLKYLESAPVGHGEPTDQGTRLEQLKAQWVKEGRIDASGSPKRSQTIAAASTSMNPSLKISISDLSNRIAMLGDVSGRVSLMRRDLATLMHSYIGGVRRCTASNQPAH